METTNQRPTLVTIICILSFAGIAFSVFNLISILLATGAEVYTIFSLVWAVGYLYATVKIWQMKKVGVNIFTGLSVIDYGLMSILYVSMAYDILIISLVITVVFLALVYSQYKKMS